MTKTLTIPLELDLRVICEVTPGEVLSGKRSGACLCEASDIEIVGVAYNGRGLQLEEKDMEQLEKELRELEMKGKL